MTEELFRGSRIWQLRIIVAEGVSAVGMSWYKRIADRKLETKLPKRNWPGQRNGQRRPG